MGGGYGPIERALIDWSATGRRTATSGHVRPGAAAKSATRTERNTRRSAGPFCTMLC